MAGYLKKELAKKLALFFKDMNPDRVSLSFFSGKGELTNLELKEDFLQSILDLPPYLLLRKASCSSVRCNLSWTKLKSQPVKIIIDNMQVVLQATSDFLTKPQTHMTQAQAQALLAAAATEKGSGKKEKYGLSDSIVDGMTVEVNYITVTFIGDTFDGTIDISQLSFKSTNHMWQVADLSQSVIKDARTNSIYVYKELSIEMLRLAVYPNSSRIHPDGKRDPLVFEVQDPRLRLIRQRSLLDNTQTLSVQMQFLLDELKLELSKYHIQTLQLMFESLMTLHDAGKKVKREMKRQEQQAQEAKQAPVSSSTTSTEAKDTSAQAQPVSFGFQAKISHGIFALREPVLHHKETARSYLTSVTLRRLILQHYPERDFSFYSYSHSLSSSVFGSEFLSEREAFVRSVGGEVLRELERAKVVKQSNTFFSCSNILFKAETDRDAAHTPQEAPGSTQAAHSHSQPQSPARAHQAAPPASSPGRGGHTSSSTAAIIHSNYHKYHLPSDTPLILLEYVEYFVSPNAREKYHDQRRYPLPPPALFARIHPITIELHQGAFMKLIRFSEACRLEPSPIDLLHHSPSASDVSEQGASDATANEAAEAPKKEEEVAMTKARELALLLTSAKAVSELQKAADVIKTAKTEHLLTEEELTELRALYVKCMASLKDPEGEEKAQKAPAQQSSTHQSASTPARAVHVGPRQHMRFLCEVLLPTIELPPLYEGPKRVREQSISILASKISITNTPRATKFGFSSSDLDDFYTSALHTHPQEFPRGQDTLSAVLPDLRHLSSSDKHYPDPHRLLVVNVDQVWMESTDHKKKRHNMLRPLGLKVFSINNSPSLEDLKKSAATKGAESEGEEQKSEESREAVPRSFTLVKIDAPVELTLTNSQLLFFMRVMDKYSKMDLLLDNGEPVSSVGVTFLSASSVTLNFLEIEKKKRKSKKSRNNNQGGEEEGRELPPPPQPFSSITLKKLQLVTHGVGRESKMSLISDSIFADMKDGNVSHRIDVPNAPHKPQIALFTQTPNPSPALSKEFYAACRSRTEQKRRLLQWQKREEKRKEHDAKREREEALASKQARQLQRLSSNASSIGRPRSASDLFAVQNGRLQPDASGMPMQEQSQPLVASSVVITEDGEGGDPLTGGDIRRSVSQDLLVKEDEMSISSMSMDRSSQPSGIEGRGDGTSDIVSPRVDHHDSQSSLSVRSHRAASVAPSHHSDGDNVSLSSSAGVLDDNASLIFHETNVDLDAVLVDFESASLGSETAISGRMDQQSGVTSFEETDTPAPQGNADTDGAAASSTSPAAVDSESETDEEDENEGLVMEEDVELIEADQDPKPEAECIELPQMPSGVTQVRVQSIALDIKSSHTEKFSRFFSDYAEPLPSKPSVVDIQVLSSRVSFLREENLLPIPDAERRSSVVVDSLYLNSDGARTWTVAFHKDDKAHRGAVDDADLRERVLELEAKLQFAEAALEASERDRHDLLKSLSDLQTDLSLTRQARAKLEEQLHGKHSHPDPVGEFSTL